MKAEIENSSAEWVGLSKERIRAIVRENAASFTEYQGRITGVRFNEEGFSDFAQTIVLIARGDLSGNVLQDAQPDWIKKAKPPKELQELIDFKRDHPHLDLAEGKDDWGCLKFENTFVQAMWEGWQRRAALPSSTEVSRDSFERTLSVEDCFRDADDEYVSADVQREWIKVITEVPVDGEPMTYVDVLFDGPPGAESGRFVEVNDPSGESVNAGVWIERDDGLWALRISMADSGRKLTDAVEITAEMVEAAYGPYLSPSSDRTRRACLSNLLAILSATSTNKE